MPIDFNYISEHPEVNGGENIVTKIVARHVTNSDGEVLENDLEKTSRVGKEPPFIKLYTDCMLVLNNLDAALSLPLIAFGNHMTYANDKSLAFRHVVRTDRLVRADVAQRCGVSDDMVKKWVKKFVEAEIFIPIVDATGKKARGVYYVNPWVIGKGEWKDIKKLRGEFILADDETKIGTCIIDEKSNTRQIYLENKQNPRNARKRISNNMDGQLSFLGELE